MPSTYTVVYDACVLYPAPLRDLLMRLARTGLFRAKWTAAIHDEWMRNLMAGRADLDQVKLQRTRELMDASVIDCLVTGYDELIPGLTLPDPDDRHVLAAAIRGGADAIVTFNLKDFPATNCAPFGIEAQHPDDFILYQLDLDPVRVIRAMNDQRQSLKNPPKSLDEFLATLEAQRLTQTVVQLRNKHYSALS